MPDETTAKHSITEGLIEKAILEINPHFVKG
ncbi:uncharacterized protein METZ01_LOCUS340665 [marine metagenome]|uniref:Uncharacterized protein n=1 Tax=marine metagenome TaxID=408172 RepID=A0A382QU05_9ZZZZ